MDDQSCSGADIDLIGARRLTTLLKQHDAEETEFVVLRHHPWAQDPARPLLLVIHPGGLAQCPVGWRTPAERRAVMAFSDHCCRSTAHEIRRALRDGHDIVTLHRPSSIDLQEAGRRRSGSAEQALWKILQTQRTRDTLLFGDDLEAAAGFILTALAPQERPSIHLCGAYAEIKYGCITQVAETLLAVVPENRLSVSPYSPGQNGPGPVWRPGLPDGIEMDLPQSVRDLFAALGAGKAV